MRFLFIVQGEGRGHLTQALALEEILNKKGHVVVETLVGKSNNRQLPGFFNKNLKSPIRRFYSPNFQSTTSGQRFKTMDSVIYNILKIPTYLHSIKFIHKQIEETKVDAVINFYEVLTGLTYAIYSIKVPQICIGHQYIFLHPDFRRPKHLRSSLYLLNIFTRLTAIGSIKKLALSFNKKLDNKNNLCIVPPLLRSDVLKSHSYSGDYIHGYILNSGFMSYINKWHKTNPEVSLHFFWDHLQEPSIKRIDDKFYIYQLDDTKFLQLMKGCKAYASTAGFESICEAMYLGKPIMMVPAHIEQDCNAYDAVYNGAGIITHDFNLSELLEFSKSFKPNIAFRYWVNKSQDIILYQIETSIRQYNNSKN